MLSGRPLPLTISMVRISILDLLIWFLGQLKFSYWSKILLLGSQNVCWTPEIIMYGFLRVRVARDFFNHPFQADLSSVSTLGKNLIKKPLAVVYKLYLNFKQTLFIHQWQMKIFISASPKILTSSGSKVKFTFVYNLDLFYEALKNFWPLYKYLGTDLEEINFSKLKI